MEGPTYLPRHKWEWLVWISLVLTGAFVGRLITVHAYKMSNRLNERHS